MSENIAAFRAVKLIPRPMIDVGARTTRSTLLGRPVAMPLAIAPTGAAGLCWYEGELALARAAAEFGVPFTLATASMTAMDLIAAALPEGRFWFQLYMYEDKALSFELVERARRAGAEALLLTVDQTAPPNREYMDRNGFNLPFRITPRTVADVIRHPAWGLGVLARYLLTTGMPRNRNYPANFQSSILADPKKRIGMANDRIEWKDVETLRSVWPGKLLVKGVLRGADAARLMDIGVDGVVVSNHGGRTFDCAAPTIARLPDVVKAVAGRGTVLLDSGVRRGSDIAKSLALGAQGVLAGRAPLYGVSAGGQAGAKRALTLLHRELMDTLAHCGCNGVDELTPDLIQ